MRHDWIFDVLTDLRSYAQKNGLRALAEKVEEAMTIARAEAGHHDDGHGTEGSGSMPPGGRAH